MAITVQFCARYKCIGFVIRLYKIDDWDTRGVTIGQVWPYETLREGVMWRERVGSAWAVGFKQR